MTEPEKSRFVYVTYIRTTAERLWSALTTTEFGRQYWLGAEARADWRPGGAWTLVFSDGRVADAGTIEELVPLRRLVIRWRNEWNPEIKAEGFSRCTMELEPEGHGMKLTVTHEIDRRPSRFIDAVSGGWPKILSNLKSLLETGEVVLPPKY